TMQYGGTTDISWATKTPDQHPLIMSNAVSQDFGKTVGWKVRSGRDFSKTFITDSSAMILNASAAALMGFKDPLGQMVRARGRQYQVIGVTEDLIRASPFEKVHPTFYTMDANQASVIDIKLNSTVGAGAAVDKIKQIVERYDPSTPFVYQFVNDQYAAKFNDEQRIGNLAAVFAALAIFISCLGLFGLASFVAEQRNKEIGIRKALGASIQQMWRLLSGEFIMLVGISLIIAAPLAYMAMHRWLAGYEFRTQISWWIFAVVAAGTIVITLCTVSFQAIKVALANPTRTLRTE
ncbi:MAG TPA: FtsX-like permease family protein, partial [Flavitalea sp.]|nr:FtsX-like permease family protein [Flavitalea sp.]